MLKKILLVFCLFLVFFTGSINAAYNPRHDVKNNTVKQTAIKDYKKGGNTINYEGVRTKLGDTSLTDEYIEKQVKDGLEGDITRAVYDQIVDQEINKSGNNTDTDAPATPAEKAAADAAAKAIAKCNFDLEGTGDYDQDVRHNIEECITGSSLVQPNVKLDVTSGGLKTVLNGWIQKIAGFLALGAMFAIAFGSLKLTLSGGEDENIKKAKDIIKWGILGFLAVISAGLLIATVVNLIYSLAG